MGFEWLRLFNPGFDLDRTVEDIDRYFVGSASSTLYGMILDNKESLKTPQKNGLFGAKKTIEPEVNGPKLVRRSKCS